MWNVAHLDRSYDDSVVQQLHMSSADYQPSTLAIETPFYAARAVGTGTHNQGYYPTAVSAIGATETLPGYQNHSNVLYRANNGQVYSTNEYGTTDGNPESSGSTSFIASRAGSYDSSFPQPVTPESGLGAHIDAYNYIYSHGQGQGGVVASPPTLSPASRHHNKKNKVASRQRKQKHPFPGFSADGLTSSATMMPGNNRSKLRSASRTSKNTHHNPPVTAEERKSRETHNNVEKQYRNRLNAHFESLLSALPETMQNGEGEESGDVLDAGDRRVSKAEVLEMARRHIKSLERECALLEGERDELRDDMERLRWLYGRCEGGDPGGPDGAAFLGQPSLS